MTEVPPVVTILGDLMQEAELRAAAAKETGAVADALTREADIKASVLAAISEPYELATHPAYALPGRRREPRPSPVRSAEREPGPGGA